MAQQHFEFKNILVIHFGQLGDVVLGLPALVAIRGRFPEAKITVLSGKSTAAVVHISGAADELIAVDRVELRDENKLRSIARILSLVRDIRRRRFDLIIDLHSLYETNLLGFLSGAKSRLYANRENRSLDRLAKFPVKPPSEDKSKHLTERYLDVLLPLNVTEINRRVRLVPDRADIDYVRTRFFGGGQVQMEKLIGIFPGAGNPSRCWKLANFADLSESLSTSGFVPAVFLGPEEDGMRDAVETSFAAGTMIFDHLTIPQFIAAVAEMAVFVTNDTGPLHLAAGTGVPIILLLDKRAPTTYLPITDKLTVVQNATIDEITVDQVADATLEMLAKTHS